MKCEHAAAVEENGAGARFGANWWLLELGEMVWMYVPELVASLSLSTANPNGQMADYDIELFFSSSQALVFHCVDRSSSFVRLVHKV